MDDGHVERVPRLLRVREVAEITGLDRWRIYDLDYPARPALRVRPDP